MARKKKQQGPVLSVAKIMARRGPLSQVRLLRATMRSLKQAGQAEGCIEAIAVPDGKGVFFAISRWESADALRTFVGSGAHAEAAKLAMKVAKCHVSGHVAWDGPEIPAWDTLQGIMEHGRIIDTPHGKRLTEDEKRKGPSRPFRGVLRAKVAGP